MFCQPKDEQNFDEILWKESNKISDWSKREERMDPICRC